MNIVLVDRSTEDLSTLMEILRVVYPDAHVKAYTDPMYLIKYAMKTPVDMLFTAASLNHLDGLTVVEVLRKRYPEVKSFVVTEDDRYIPLAASIGVDGYILKPVNMEKIREAAAQPEDG